LFTRENSFDMEEESKLVREFKKVIGKQEGRFKKTEKASLSTANNYYNKLIENGVMKKRGFTLRGIEDAHLFNVKLNRH